MPAIILLAVWKNFGFNMVIFLAGLQASPSASTRPRGSTAPARWQQLRHVTLPMLAPTFVFVAVMTMIGYFQLFAEPYVMTQGGPADATLSVVLLMYEEGFRWWNMGYARGGRVRALRDHPCRLALVQLALSRAPRPEAGRDEARASRPVALHVVARRRRAR